MAERLRVSVGQCSDKGFKRLNQDYHGVRIPEEPLLTAKGIAVALADGIGSSEVSDVASETAITTFLADYFCTSDAWSVKRSAQRVLLATNSWLHAQTQNSRYRGNIERGYVCTFSALILKSATAHLCHVGDARIYRLDGQSLEQLTEDHRHWISEDSSYLSRALGVDDQIEIDYRTLQAEVGDVFVLATDGVHEFLGTGDMVRLLNRSGDDLDDAAQAMVEAALAAGSDDNLTVQVVRIDALPEPGIDETQNRLGQLPFPPELAPRMQFDGYEIVRQVHVSSRSHVYLARDAETGATVALKTPSKELQQDPVLLERFLTEEWIARRIDNPHVVKPSRRSRKQGYLYVALEFVEGRTLTQWMTDNPDPSLEQVRDLLEQIGKGLRAFHRQEMVHQDLRPDNVLIDDTGTAKITDFGSASVAGIAESTADDGRGAGVVTEQYAAPEYFLGEPGTSRSDIFSLGVIAYQMLTGTLPYGTQVARVRSRAAVNKLNYTPVRHHRRDCPVWIDGAVRQAVHPDPGRRHQEVSEFLYDLRHPRREFLSETRPPLIERNPEAFWKSVSLLLGVAVAVLLVLLERA